MSTAQVSINFGMNDMEPNLQLSPKTSAREPAMETRDSKSGWQETFEHVLESWVCLYPQANLGTGSEVGTKTAGAESRDPTVSS